MMKIIVIKILLAAFFIFLTATNGKKLTGDWMTLDSYNDYAEFYFSHNQIQIFHEVGGFLSLRNYELINDSLLSEIGNYKINWVNMDSVHLTRNNRSIIMKRIKYGNRMSKYIENKKKFDQNFKDAFWTRMSTWKELPF